MVNLPSKFEVPSFNRYAIMKALQNVENGVVWGGYGVTQAYPQCHHSIERVRLSIRL